MVIPFPASQIDRRPTRRVPFSMEYLALAALALISQAAAQLCAEGSQASFTFDNVPSWLGMSVRCRLCRWHLVSQDG